MHLCKNGAFRIRRIVLVSRLTRALHGGGQCRRLSYLATSSSQGPSTFQARGHKSRKTNSSQIPSLSPAIIRHYSLFQPGRRFENFKADLFRINCTIQVKTFLKLSFNNQKDPQPNYLLNYYLVYGMFSRKKLFQFIQFKVEIAFWYQEWSQQTRKDDWDGCQLLCEVF
jgi:hypothetical protein